MVIGPQVRVKGDMKFEGLLQIDGAVEGQLIAPSEVSLCAVRGTSALVSILVHF